MGPQEASMLTLTAELRREIEKAEGNPVRLEDPETNSAYVHLRVEEYDRLKPDLVSETVPTEQVPEGIRRSKEAFLRDLPGVMARKRLHRRWVLYHGNVQVGIARRPDKLLRKCAKLGVRNDEFYLGVIEPHSQEPEEIEHSFLEFEELEPVT
jgi:hypothetical protein